LNQLLRRKKFARVSNTPGRTREINFFRVNDSLILVDLPGYGYARVSKEQRASWRPLIEGYLQRSPQLRGVVQLLDARHDPTQDDEQMLGFLAELGVPSIIVLTKIDKLTATQAARRIAEISSALALEPEQVISFSAVSGRGRDELAEAIMALVAQPSWKEATA
jgi:GTP-binding protein